MVSIGDPLGSGFVASLARPGGNITGVSNITVDLSAKLVGLLIEFVPDMKRVGVMHNPFNPNATMQLRQRKLFVNWVCRLMSSRLTPPRNTSAHSLA